MRIMLTALLCMALMSCGGRRSLLPQSGGRLCEVVVAGDSCGIVAGALSRAVEGLPQPEPSFDIALPARTRLEGAALLARNIVLVNIDSARFSRTSVRYGRDVYASGQIVVYVGAPSAGRLRADLRGSDVLVRLLRLHELAAAIDRLRRKHNPSMEDRVRRMFCVDICLPPDMTASKAGRDFMWMSNNSPTVMQNICIYSVPGTACSRDSVMRANIKGETDAMYMATVEGSVTERRTTVGGVPAVERRGLWEMRGDAMGGPFVSYAMRDPRGGTLVVEAFAFAPGTGKRNVMLSLEAALLTVRLPAARAAANQNI